MRRAIGFPALCLLLNLHAAGKGLPGRAEAGDEMGRKLHMLGTLGKACLAKNAFQRQSPTVLAGEG